MSEESQIQFQFTKVQGGYVISDAFGNIKKMVIPETYRGEPVIHINQNAFANLLYLEEVTIPASIKRVDTAFRRKYSLRKVVCMSQETRFDRHAFNLCYHLEDLPFFVWEQVCSFSFQYLPFLRYRFTHGTPFTTEEKEELFSFILERPDLVEEIFEEGLTAVMSFLIQEGLSLTLLQVSEYLAIQIESCHTQGTAILLEYRERNFTKEEVAAFIERNELLEIGLVPPTFTELERNWLVHEEDDGALKIIRYRGKKFQERMPSQLEDGRKILGTFHQMNGAYRPLKKLVLEEGIRFLDQETFCRCETLEEIILPESLESMGLGCFASCESLQAIQIPANVKELPKDCFSDCFALEKVTLSQGLVAIGTFAFANCQNLKEIILPEGLLEIDERAFWDCPNLQKIVIPSSVKVLSKGAIQNCERLEKVMVSGETTVEEGGLKECPLAKIVITERK